VACPEARQTTSKNSTRKSSSSQRTSKLKILRVRPLYLQPVLRDARSPIRNIRSFQSAWRTRMSDATSQCGSARRLQAIQQHVR
jgi:hypothetical protein